MTPPRDPGSPGQLDEGTELADLVGSAMAARDAAATAAGILGRALAATREPTGTGRQEAFEQALGDAARRPVDEFRRVLRWMAGALIATAELAGEALDRDPGTVLARTSGIRSLTSRRGRKEGGVTRAMASVVGGLACDLPHAEAAIDGLAAGLTPSGRHIALAWSAEVTVGLLSLVSLATGDDEADVLSQLAEHDLLDPTALLEECGIAALPGRGPDPGPGAAPPDGGDGGVPERSFGQAIRTAAAERRAIGVVTAFRTGEPVALDATLDGLSRQEVGEVCAALAGCVAGASAVAGAVLDELVDGVAPDAVRLVVDQAGAIARGDTGVDPGLRSWLREAGLDEVRSVVSGFAQAAWAALAIAAAEQAVDPETYLRGVAADIAAELAVAGVDGGDPCPCGSDRPYGRCCGR